MYKEREEKKEKKRWLDVTESDISVEDAGDWIKWKLRSRMIDTK